MAQGGMITRTYESINGVDFSNEGRNVSHNRGVMIVNMYKNYEDDSKCVVTREGYKLIADLSSLAEDENEDKTIYGIHIYTSMGTSIALVHMGRYLYLYEDFPSFENEDSFELLCKNMNCSKSSSFMYNDNLYINDGMGYYKYDGEKIVDIGDLNRINEQMLTISGDIKEDSLDVPFVPTTSVSRLPEGGGESYQGVNVLTPWRKNSFSANGKDKTFYLDTSDLTREDIDYVKVWINDTYIDLVNGTELTYEVRDEESGTSQTKTTSFKLADNGINKEKGRISFNEPPPSPLTLGGDNVVILFYKKSDEHKKRISSCKINTVFDNRVFFSKSSIYKNALFHSELNNPEYVSDLNYYQDGSDNEGITSVVVAGSVLWVFKDGKEGGNNLFYHKAFTEEISTVNFAGKTEVKKVTVYPSKQGKSSFGSIGCSVNFLDDVCFLSKEGMYGLKYSDLNSDIYSLDFVCPRSTLINPKLIKEDGYKDACMDVYKGYLCILINSKMYLADSRSTYKVGKGYEYEWFYFKDIRVKNEDESFSPGVYLKVFDNNMFFGTTNGQICVFESDSYEDNGEEIENYIILRSDNFDSINHLKTTSKRGGIAKFKVMGNSGVNVYVRTDKSKDFRFVASHKNSGFSFLNFDFGAVSFFFDKDNNYKVLRTKQKKFNELQIKLVGESSDKKRKMPFGFFSLTLEAFKGSYIKR